MSHPFTEQQLAFFRQFLKENSGYQLIEGKEYLLESRLKTVLEVDHLNTYDDIIAHINREPHGTVAIDVIEAMTVNETFFFRDDKPFQIFEAEIVPKLAEISKTRVPKIWSAACSTGQEPYSVAIILEEAKHKYPGIQYDIQASDINNRILAKARQGIYSHMEVARGLGEEQRNKYFTALGDVWRINDDIKNRVTFFQQNLREGPETFKGPYDVVFMRNVLIYFDMELKTQILKKTMEAMQPEAHLILGASENIYDPSLGLVRDTDLSGVYKKAPTDIAEAQTA